ncbi:MAG TPA: carbon-nitrogen hydrolase family protein [Gemmatimonadaceae bacterium]|nr:carbon-nitrogen hydrolase family protein [Gemmatimonadaceae bacterium]
MAIVRIALANLPFADSGDAAVASAEQAIAEAGARGARVICFPECFVPGYRTVAKPLAPPHAAFLERAWKRIGDAARRAKVGVVLGTERVVGDRLLIAAHVFDDTGHSLGFQDKVQLDPSEDGLYSPGTERRVFSIGDLTFGISICHEGWRYPETTRWSAVHGAQLVFHPHYHWAEADSFRPTSFADPRNTFHEKALLCRAAENTVFVASVNYASEGSGTTSAVVRPDGTVLAWHPYGEPGLLLTDIDTSEATRLLASRYKPVAP